MKIDDITSKNHESEVAGGGAMQPEDRSENLRIIQSRQEVGAAYQSAPGAEARAHQFSGFSMVDVSPGPCSRLLLIPELAFCTCSPRLP